MMHRFAAAAGVILLSGCSFVGVRAATEQPKYSVVDRLPGKVEIRRYSPRIAVETTVEANTPDARSQAFRRLFRYITGANKGKSNISMTAPVSVAKGEKISMTAPVETRRSAAGLVMRFFLPAKFTAETAPRPTDPTVRIVTIPEQTMAALRYSGRRTDDAAARQQALLLKALEGSGWTAQGKPIGYYYDPPYTPPPLRRNEAVVPVVKRSLSTQ